MMKRTSARARVGVGWLDGSRSDLTLRAAELAVAIAANQIDVHYQPVVKLLSGQVASVEALARWTHPIFGPISPADFVGIAEDFDLIADLTECVVNRVAVDSGTWVAEGRHLVCAVNLSVLALTDPERTERLIGLLSSLAGRVTVEVTESVMANPAAIAVLRKLADTGVPCAIDDFGTGYSSLGALKNLPVTTLKIDRSLIKDIEHDRRDFAMVNAIVELAGALGMDVIAEGMETLASVQRAGAAGVHLAQGFFFARPLPASQLASWLDSRPSQAEVFVRTAWPAGNDGAVIGPVDPGQSVGFDAGAGAGCVEILLAATRALLRVESSEEAVGVLLRAVLDFGGSVVPGTLAPADAIPIDISLGEAGPMLPVAPSGTSARRNLERLLPGLVEDARTAANRAGRMTRLAEQVDVDPLTGLGNRRGLTRVRVLHNVDAIAMVDLDHFKRVNDTYGHDDGDRILVAFSRAMRQHLRASDLVFRLGGEEFLLIMPGTSAQSALIALAKLRERWCSERPRPVTFSAGIAVVESSDLSAAILAADVALYAAKNGGRDRFELATNAPSTAEVGS